MSKPIEAVLAECEDLISRNEVARANENIIELINFGSKEDLERLQNSIKEIIGRFLPKRKRSLTDALNKRFEPTGGNSDNYIKSNPKFSLNDLEDFEANITVRLDSLSSWHIFQWSTYYRDELRGIMADIVTLIRNNKDADTAFDLLGKQIRRHSTEIFSKGYGFVRSQTWATEELAIGKSLAGLRAFLELPVELYADESSRLNSSQDCRVLRRATSRILSGVIIGFSDAHLGNNIALELLQRTIKSWSHVLPLLEKRDLEAVNQKLDLETLSPLLGGPLSLLATALDEASRMSSVDPVVVISASISLDDRVLDVTLRPPADSSDTKPLELAILGGEGEIVRHQIEQRAKLGYIACVTYKSAATYWGGKFVPKNISDLVVPFSDASTHQSGFLLERLRLRFYEKSIVVQPSAPLRTNIAERFPLENPTLLTFFRVQRPSIRALETIISTRTGVLLWCSVRRSGKTTGVSELASGIQEKSAVFQRCEMTGLDPTSRMLFEAVCDALGNLTPLPRDFLRKLVAQAAPMGVAPSRGSILILDEYDRLFGRLRAAGRRNEDARHLIVQPLLDQFVEFATENLLIFLGQQPNAHFIFMDQNQLSAYVQQEPYPLFSHELAATHGEFWDLIGKVFQQTLKYDASYANAVFEETGGHPFLTVNLLRDFVDWLINRKVVPQNLLLTRDVFDDFTNGQLKAKALGLSKHFDYFRSAASEALSDDGASESPWVHAVYSLLRLLGKSGKDGKFALDRSEVEKSLGEVLDKIQLTGFTCESFIVSATRSNFVDVDLKNDLVIARIPILARIAAATR